MGILRRIEDKLDRLLQAEARINNNVVALLAGQEELKSMLAELGDRPAADGIQAGLEGILSYNPGKRTEDRGDKA